MDEFNLQLTGQLDQTSSKKQIDKDLVTIAKAVEKLKLQAEIDPNSVKNIAKQLAGIINQKVVVNNIQIDNQQISKIGEQAGQKFGTSFNQNLQSSLNNVKQNIKNIISEFSNQKLNSYDLSKAFNLNRSGIDASVTQNIRSITTELNLLAKEVLKTDSDSSWEGIITKINELYRVLNQFGTIRDLTGYEESLKVLDYFQNKKIFVGDKSEALSNTGMSIKELNNQFRNLGVTFTSVAENSVKLDTVWNELFSISPGLQKFETFGDQINAIVDHFKIAKDALYGDSNLQPLSGGEINDFIGEWLTGLENASKKLGVLRSEQSELEQSISQSSTSTANTVIQNEQKKQQAIQETANAYKALSENESIVKSGAGVTTFEGTNNAAKEAQQYFRDLLKDEQAVIATTEQFGSNNNLTSFAINIKRASGEVETLRYTLDALKDDEGNITDTFYRLSGSSTGDAGAIKQIQQIENAFTDFTQKLAQFKSTNSEILSGLTAPLSDFENKLAGLKNGTSTINEVTQAYKSLNTEASNITANFSRQLSPIDSAIRNLAKGEETVAGLRAEFKGLNNAPKEINTELNKCSSLLAKVKQIESEQGRTSEWSQAYKEWSNSVDTLKAKLTTLRKEQNNVASTQIFNISDLKNNDIAYMSKVYNTIEKQMSEINKMVNAKNWNIVDISGVEQANGKIKQLTLTVKDAEGALKKLTMQREKLQGNGKAQYGLMQVGDVKVIETAAQAQEKLAQSAEKANAKLVEQANKIQLSLDNGDYDKKFETLKASYEKLGLTSDEVKVKINEVSIALDKLKEKNLDSLVQDEKNFANALKKSQNEASILKLDLENIYNPKKQLKLSTDIQNWLSKNSRASKDAKDSLNAYYRELSGGRVSVDRLNYIRQELDKIDATQRGLGKLGKNLKDQFAEAGRSFTQWLSVSSGIMALVYQLQRIPKEVIKINSAMIELKKVSNASASEVSKYFDEAAESAKRYGSSVSDMINATADWSRLGYNLPDSKKLAEIATLYTNVGDGIDMSSANQSLISTLQGFQLEAEDALSIIDKFNEVANNFPIDTAGIGEALQRSAASFYAANTDLSKSIALITGTNSVVQDPDAVGNMWKTVSMRIRSAKQELEEAGEETDGMVESTAQLRELIKGLTGFDIMADKAGTQFKDIYDIVIGIGHEWKNLTDIEQAGLLEALAGKRQGNALSAALNNISMIEEAYKTAENSAGSALKEQEEYEKGIEYSLKRLEAAFQTFSNNVLDSSFVKGIVDFGTKSIEIIDKVTSKLGSLGTIGAGAGLFAGFKNFGKVRECVPFNFCFEYARSG